MPVRNNPILGHTICSECEETATVHQQSRGAGRYLYTRGCDCKYRNSTGKVFQTRLWRETDWLPDANPIRPPNVGPAEVAPEQPPIRSGATIEPDGDDLTSPSDGAVELTEVGEDESISGWLVAGLSLLAGAALFLLSGGRRLP